ncbi:MAG: HAMP domain-containing protein [Acidobacteria bacterium]|nr:HAMP domain-containing protein [Acidobacteriota bacterium]
MFSSIRTKLTLWYSAVLALVLITFALLFYFLIDQTVKQSVDDSLEDASDSLITRLQNAPDFSDASMQTVLNDFRFQYTVFVIYDKDFSIIAASPRLIGDPKLKFPSFNISTEEIPKPMLQNSFSGEASFYTFDTRAKTAVRFFIERPKIHSREFNVATMRPLTIQFALLSNIRLIFFAGIPFALIFSSIGGYYLAMKSLEPVRRMGEKVSFITSQNLNERLPASQQNDELDQLAAIFNKMLTRLEGSFDLQRRFMADASHEFRTPLAIMRGEAEVSLQKDERTEDEYRESLEVIRQEGVRLSHIVEDLLTLARADAEQYKINPSTFYLDEVVTETARSLRTLIQGRNIKLSVEADENLMFHGDESLIRRLLIILLDNAIKYSDDGGKISLSCAETDSDYEITVSNSGSFIPENEQTRAFERFYRADKVRSRRNDYQLGTGAGLGLSIGTWIAKVHDGSLSLKRSDENKTSFMVSLPKP